MFDPLDSEYFSCYVPNCPNTSHTNTGLLYTRLPRNPATRQLWLDAVSPTPFIHNTEDDLYCCQDHFVLSDVRKVVMNSYGQRIIKFHKGTLPHVFRPLFISSQLKPVSFVHKSRPLKKVPEPEKSPNCGSVVDSPAETPEAVLPSAHSLSDDNQCAAHVKLTAEIEDTVQSEEESSFGSVGGSDSFDLLDELDNKAEDNQEKQHSSPHPSSNDQVNDDSTANNQEIQPSVPHENSNSQTDNENYDENSSATSTYEYSDGDSYDEDERDNSPHIDVDGIPPQNNPNYDHKELENACLYSNENIPVEETNQHSTSNNIPQENYTMTDPQYSTERIHQNEIAYQSNPNYLQGSGSGAKPSLSSRYLDANIPRFLLGIIPGLPGWTNLAQPEYANANKDVILPDFVLGIPTVFYTNLELIKKIYATECINPDHKDQTPGTVPYADDGETLAECIRARKHAISLKYMLNCHERNRKQREQKTNKYRLRTFSDSSKLMPTVIDQSSIPGKKTEENNLAKPCTHYEIYRDLYRQWTVKRTRHNAQENTMDYLGLPESMYFMVEHLQRMLSLPCEDPIVLTLMRLRIDPPFRVLGDDYCVTPKDTFDQFNDIMPYMSRYLRQLIPWTPKDKTGWICPEFIEDTCPLVTTVMYFYTVRIETDSVTYPPMESWCPQSRCHIVKFVVGCSTAGMISFVSRGYGSAITDRRMLETCGYLNTICRGSVILVPRDLAHLESVFSMYGFYIQPAPLSTVGQNTPWVDMYVNRLRDRFKKFSFLNPRDSLCRIDTAHLDDAMVVVSAIINLQPPPGREMFGPPEKYEIW